MRKFKHNHNTYTNYISSDFFILQQTLVKSSLRPTLGCNHHQSSQSKLKPPNASDTFTVEYHVWHKYHQISIYNMNDFAQSARDSQAPTCLAMRAPLTTKAHGLRLWMGHFCWLGRHLRPLSSAFCAEIVSMSLHSLPSISSISSIWIYLRPNDPTTCHDNCALLRLGLLGPARRAALVM